MEVKIRSIGNSMGIILPRDITRRMNLHVEDVIELDVDEENKRLIVEHKKQALRENLLQGIKASQEENLAFVNDFDVSPGQATGLTKESLINTQQIRTIDKLRILKKLGKLPKKLESSLD